MSSSATTGSTQNAERLFPNKRSLAVFWAYILLFVSQGILIKKIQRSPFHGSYAPVVVLLTELVKLVICVSIHVTRSPRGFKSLLSDVAANRRLLLLYMVPALLYCLYNNLQFKNLSLFDVSTYYCLLQFRIVLTAIIYQFLFRRNLNLIQWASLLILTTGCFIKEYSLIKNTNTATAAKSTVSSTPMTRLNPNDDSEYQLTEDLARDDEQIHGLELLLSSGLLLCQIFCSCFAGVYNEYLLKSSPSAAGADIILQNIFMYTDSIVCNLIVYFLSSKSNIADGKSIVGVVWSLLTSELAIVLIINNALAGLVASLFLKSLNSIVKTFASALEVFAVTYLAWYLFGDKVDLYTLIALSLVSLAMFIYANNPVSAAPPEKEPPVESREGFVRVPMSDD